MTPAEIAKQLDHASKQDDRWLMLLMFGLLCFTLFLVVKFLVGQFTKAKSEHAEAVNALVDNLKTVNTEVRVSLDRNTTILQKLQTFLENK